MPAACSCAAFGDPADLLLQHVDDAPTANAEMASRRRDSGRSAVAHDVVPHGTGILDRIMGEVAEEAFMTGTRKAPAWNLSFRRRR